MNNLVPISLLASATIIAALLAATPASASSVTTVFVGVAGSVFGTQDGSCLWNDNAGGLLFVQFSQGSIHSFQFVSSSDSATGAGTTIAFSGATSEPLSGANLNHCFTALVAQDLQVTSATFDCATGSVSIQASNAQAFAAFGGSGLACQDTLDVSSAPCFTYNPQALTNACVQLTPTTEYVPSVGTTPTPETIPIVSVGTTPGTLCIIGTECVPTVEPTITPGSTTVTVPVPTVNPDGTPVTVPLPSGYVEVTAACSLNVPCQVTL